MHFGFELLQEVAHRKNRGVENSGVLKKSHVIAFEFSLMLKRYCFADKGIVSDPLNSRVLEPVIELINK